MQYFADVQTTPGVVREIVQIPDGVNLADCFHEDFVARLVPCAADTKQGDIYNNGAFSTPVPVPPSRESQMAEAFAAGCVVASTTKPSLASTYAVLGDLWQRMRDEAQYVATFQAFSGGVTILEWTTLSGVVDFNSITDFLSVVRVLGDWITGWIRYTNEQTSNPPSSPAELA